MITNLMQFAGDELKRAASLIFPDIVWMRADNQWLWRRYRTPEGLAARVHENAYRLLTCRRHEWFGAVAGESGGGAGLDYYVCIHCRGEISRRDYEALAARD